jgi:hypothetical protein
MQANRSPTARIPNEQWCAALAIIYINIVKDATIRMPVYTTVMTPHSAFVGWIT